MNVYFKSKPQLTLSMKHDAVKSPVFSGSDQRQSVEQRHSDEPFMYSPLRAVRAGRLMSAPADCTADDE